LKESLSWMPEDDSFSRQGVVPAHQETALRGQLVPIEERVELVERQGAGPWELIRNRLLSPSVGGSASC